MKGKHILVGLTGGIAAYKIAHLIRLFVKNGAEVRVIMTPTAKQFITPLTLATLSKNPILVDFFDPENGAWNSHVDIGLWADAYVIAPATANSMAKMAHGVADNLLITTYLSARCQVFVAPAMDLDMFVHPTTIRNLETLANDGVRIIQAGTGELASGLSGKGRMAEPEDIYATLNDYFAENQTFKNTKVLITAGPTYEPIDPVRFVGNHSSGKMGYALAEHLAELGAQVDLVSGPTQLTVSQRNIELHRVQTAAEMEAKVDELMDAAQVIILAAAVADYTPVNPAKEKIKRKEPEYEIRMKSTTDIAAKVGIHKTENQIVVGFALETNNALVNAQKKLESKNLDLIVLNSLENKGAGFGHDTNKVSILHKNGRLQEFDLKPKKEVAKDIVDAITDYLK